MLNPKSFPSQNLNPECWILKVTFVRPFTNFSRGVKRPKVSTLDGSLPDSKSREVLPLRLKLLGERVSTFVHFARTSVGKSRFHAS